MKKVRSRSFFTLLLAVSTIIFVIALTSCSQNQQLTPITIDFTPVGTNYVQLEKIAENRDWRVVVHWTRDRDSLPSFSETYKPKPDHYFLTVYVSFERNPAFGRGEGAINLSYIIGKANFMVQEAGVGNNEVFDNRKADLTKSPDPKDPNDKPYSEQLYFEIPKSAQHLQLSFGSAPPVDLQR